MERGMNYRQGKNSQQKEPTARKESLSPTNPLSSGGYIYICPLSSAEREERDQSGDLRGTVIVIKGMRCEGSQKKRVGKVSPRTMKFKTFGPKNLRRRRRNRPKNDLFIKWGDALLRALSFVLAVELYSDSSYPLDVPIPTGRQGWD